MKYFKDIIITCSGVIVLLLAIVGICSIYGNVDTTTPVEDMSVVDSLTQVNDSIKIQVESLDSVKNAKIIEVYSLDNDSTVKLFYKLVSE